MAVKHLPKAITKLDLFEKAQIRFQQWVDLYADSEVSEQQMYEDMSCSCYSGDPEYDFPDDFKAEQDSTIRYQYKEGSCYFIVDGITIEVLDLRDMRKNSEFGEARYADICIPVINYTETDGTYMCHVIPNTWLYGSTTDDFDEGAEVQPEFINAARDYIKMNHITKKMQEVQ